MIQMCRGYLGQQLRQVYNRGMRRLEEGVVVGQGFHLLPGDLGQFLAPVTHIDAPQSRHAVQ